MTAWKEGVNLYRVTRIIYFSRKRTLPFARREKGSRLAEFIALIQIYRVKVRVNGDRSEVIRRKSNPLRPSDAKVVFWNNALQVMSFYSNPDNATAGKIRSASASLPFLHAPLSLYPPHLFFPPCHEFTLYPLEDTPSEFFKIFLTTFERKWNLIFF